MQAILALCGAPRQGSPSRQTPAPSRLTAGARSHLRCATKATPPRSSRWVRQERAVGSRWPLGRRQVGVEHWQAGFDGVVENVEQFKDAAGMQSVRDRYEVQRPTV